MAPFKGSQLASFVLPKLITEIQGHCQECRTSHGGPGTLSRTIDANLDFAFVQKHLLSPFQLLGGLSPLCPPRNNHPSVGKTLGEKFLGDSSRVAAAALYTTKHAAFRDDFGAAASWQ